MAHACRAPQAQAQPLGRPTVLWTCGGSIRITSRDRVVSKTLEERNARLNVAAERETSDKTEAKRHVV